MAKKAKRISKTLTPAERSSYKKKLTTVEADKEELIAKGRAAFAAHEAVCKAVKQLKAARERQNLSLADIRDFTGISREAISKLENNQAPNPTFRTLMRYASAVGVKLELKIVSAR